MRHRVIVLGLLLVGVFLAACKENPQAGGPIVHCFNEETGEWQNVSPTARVVLRQDVNTGKVTVTCPTGQ